MIKDGNRTNWPRPAAEGGFESLVARVFSKAAHVPVGEIMTRSPKCVPADLALDALAELFTEKATHGVTVIDEAGKPIGMVSKTNLIRALREGVDGATAATAMTPSVCSLTIDASISHAAALMVFHGVHHLVVLSDSGDWIGDVSALDLARWLAEQDGYVLPRDDSAHLGSPTRNAEADVGH
jgi:CBS domain-containing protein